MWRRRGLLSVFCGVECAGEYVQDAYEACARDAFYAAEDSGRRQMWRRLTFVMEVPGAPSAVRNSIPAQWAEVCSKDDPLAMEMNDTIDPAAPKACVRLGVGMCDGCSVARRLIPCLQRKSYTVELRPNRMVV